MEKGSVAICFVRQAVSALPLRGIDPAPVLRAAGISPALLDAPLARVSAERYGALWLGVARALDDEFFGQDSRRMKCGSFAMLCHAIVDTTTFAQALDRIGRYFGLLLDDLGVELQSGGDLAALALTAPSAHASSVFAHETMLVMLHGLMSWLLRRRVPVRLATFRYPEPPYSAEYRVMYSRQLAFGQPATALWFDAALLDEPVRLDARSLKTFLRDAPHNIVVKYSDRHSMVMKIRRLLRSRRPDTWPTFEALAEGLHLSVSSLRRRLMDEGASYQALKDELRRDLAIEALSHTDQPVTEIAATLGFAEPGAFHRAFRRWTGSRPGAYRIARQQ